MSLDGQRENHRRFIDAPSTHCSMPRNVYHAFPSAIQSTNNVIYFVDVHQPGYFIEGFNDDVYDLLATHTACLWYIFASP